MTVDADVRTTRKHAARRLLLIRTLVAISAVLGINYVSWRWLHSVNWAAWWISVPLVIVETYSLIDSLLFGMTMWRLKERGEPDPAPVGLTVDVFITTYNEPVEMVMATARAAQLITYPHRTWILDDGARAEMQAAAELESVGYLTRSDAWVDRPRHAKAGNLNNALLVTDGEFILILDSDQIPEPHILDRTLGYFSDPRVALVQTPQFFVNVSESDPLGSQAPLFYGPIQQGKDGWNSAFFCGSNAVIRREALMQLGIQGYVAAVEKSVRSTLRTADTMMAKAQRQVPSDDTQLKAALQEVRDAVGTARRSLSDGTPLSEITYAFQQRVNQVARGVVSEDVARLRADLAEINEFNASVDADPELVFFEDDLIDRLAERDWSPLGAIESVKALLLAVDVDRDDEAQPIMPMATISVTEDMATAMRLHSHGWRTVYHHEIMANGLAPEDAATMLTQRLRWAQGTLQVLFRENPLTQKGLSFGQRLMYFATMWSYLSGFAAIVYIAAPIIYLCFGVLPVHAFSFDFFIRLIPFLVFNQLVFAVVARGIKTWRGQQYSLALFPIWIRAFTTAFNSVVFGRSLGFAVTPKTKQVSRRAWRLVRPQLIAMGALVVAACIGLIRMAIGDGAASGTLVNVAWVLFDLLILSVIVQAVRYPGYEA
ncbi:cellulose synthase (UDP-forming) [Nakamurella panacisegetis]|uniref:Cellulose synthase (UDP-forming) n=1 Tax=Nakamurella panacisegetis TaxID=1090615 RepID=A0A1H0IRX4_9ACTN|nr:glycosyltransferase family 2 protein [Nakamurella panacisegetis]SDO34050.1 cellulose synthase (UDP-forming) [Nakamurella panacisegetis]